MIGAARWGGISFAAWLALTALVIGASRAQPALTSIISANPCELPCFYGIDPGVSDGDAPERVARAAPWRGGSPSYRLFDDRNNPAAATFLTDRERSLITSIFVFRLRAETRLGDLGDLMARRKPQRVLFACSRATQSVYITFGETESIGAEVRPLGGRLRPNLPIVSLVLLDPARQRGSFEVFGCTEGANWIGFAPWWRYFRR
jgi:hypothetical protein